MMFRTFSGRAILLWMMASATNPIGAQQPKMCGTPPDQYPCPPPEPEGAAARSPAHLEQYRVALERFRVSMEAARKERPDELRKYEEGLDAYKKGIGRYKEAVKEPPQ